MSKIVVYTAIFGKKDILKNPINYSDKFNVDLICFTDDKNLKSDFFKIIYVKPKFKDLSKNSKFFKIAGFDGILNYEIAIWHDASIQINFDKMDELLSYKGNTLSAFRHPKRQCIYREAISCVKYNRDYSFIILLQICILFLKGLPINIGLTENGILVINIKKYFKSEIPIIWWKYVKHFSKRDQLSLSYALFLTNEKVGILKGSGINNDYSLFSIHNYDHFIDNSFNAKFNYRNINSIKKKISILFIRFIIKLARIKNKSVATIFN